MVLFGLTAANIGCAKSNSAEAGAAATAAPSGPTSIPKGTRTFTTDALKDITVVGPGAGKIETGYALLQDIIELNKRLKE